jgi:hypothetical protein
MRVPYVPHNQKDWEALFKVQVGQSGHGAIGFKGSAYQRGGGIGSLLGGLLRSFLPIAKTIGKTVGKQALKTGVEIASDTLQGENIVESLDKRGRAAASRLIVKGVRSLDKPKPKARRKRNQKGGAIGFRLTPSARKAAILSKNSYGDQLA